MDKNTAMKQKYLQTNPYGYLMRCFFQNPVSTQKSIPLPSEIGSDSDSDLLSWSRIGSDSDSDLLSDDEFENDLFGLPESESESEEESEESEESEEESEESEEGVGRGVGRGDGRGGGRGVGRGV